ncbi:Rne/Rng family ribonuclease [Acidimangrovimonas pyrenivorans]|uniref:Ribonuclease E n=1 Tax=Acidimangrovimonas pyrenivorans TaxID=2030798 RepID=A0ABV7AGX6_9RHOB
MAKKMLIDATHAEETRVVVVDGNKVEEFDFETVNKRQLAGNIYLAKVTRVEPSLQAAFVDYGGNRHGFLAFSEIHPDYYQIPTADREALLAEERAYAAAQDEDDGKEGKGGGRKRRSRRKSSSAAEAVTSADAVETAEATPAGDAPAEAAPIEGMAVVDLGEDKGADALYVAEEAKPEAAEADSAEAPVEATEDATEAAAEDTATEGAAAEDKAEAEASVEEAQGEEPAAKDDKAAENGDDNGEEEDETYRAMDHATELDDEIESVADEDVTEEIRQPRKPRPRRYKIQEVIKVRQIMLVQVVKEERGNKGAALTTYLSLAGRYCVLMPNTARGGGISRKITQAADRKKLKEIASEIKVPEGAGLIIRTAGAKRTKAEIKRDYEYLMRLWEQIRELTLKSIAPAPIYEEGNLIKRSIRDLYNREIDEVLVEGAEGYRVAKDFMKMIMPSHAKNVKQYTDPLPLFARFQVESYLSGMFNPVVQLKSGGYIVIGVTEALVAIDVNSGRATKEGSIEDTATKTNLEAAEEVARQLRLRDLAGLIVIDFIDMEERKNNAAVEKKLKDKLKTDRARIQVGRISGFGLLEMSRQRLRPGMLESTTQPCPHCHGTGLIRSDDSLALQILRALEEEGTRKRSREVLLKAPIAIVNFLMNQKREHVATIEARYGMSVRVEADPSLVSPDFTIEKFKTATRVVEATAPVVSIDMTAMPEPVEEEEEIEAEAETPAEGDEGQAPRKKRRRRRRRKGNGNGESGGETGGEAAEAQAGEEQPAETAEAAAEASVEAAAEASAEATAEAPAEVTEEAAEAAPKKRRSRGGRGRGKAKAEEAAETPAEAAVEAPTEAAAAAPTEAPAEAPTETPAEAAEGAEAPAETAEAVAAEAVPEKPKKPTRRRRTTKKAVEPAAPAEAAAEAEAAPAPVAEPAAEAVEAAAEAPTEPVAPAEPEAVTPAEEPVAAEAAPEAAPAAPAVAEEGPAEEKVPEPVAEAAGAAPEPEAKPKPKRRGWWSLGR